MGTIREATSTSYGETLDIRFSECPGPLNSVGFTVCKPESVGVMIDWLAKNRDKVVAAAKQAKAESQSHTAIMSVPEGRVGKKVKAPKKAKFVF